MSGLGRGMRIGHYELLDQIGRTGMSEVWRAKDREGKMVALKTISSQAGEDAQLRARFLREGGEHQRLSHPAIVPILDFFEQDGGFYLVMQYLSGGSLEDHLERNNWGPLPIPKALKIASQILPALDYAHQRLIIHRDVKPSNILLEGDRAFLSDFGIALALARPRLTTYSQILGTRCYMSPEQILTPLEITHLADVYSFGCVLYELITGQQPFGQEGDTQEGQYAMMDRRLHEPPVPPREWNPEIPPRLERIVLTSLAPQPQDRFSGCGSFARALEAVERERTATISVPAIPPTPPPPAPPVQPVIIPVQPIIKPVAPPSFLAVQQARVPVMGLVAAALFSGLFWIPFVSMTSAVLFVSQAISSVLFLVVLYKAWASLAPGLRRTTPGKAVGYLFIPLYNLLWLWNAILGFARDYNQYLRKSGSQLRPQPVALYAFFCIFHFYLPTLAVLSGDVSAVRVLIALDVMILVPVMIGVIASAINKLPPAEAQQPAVAARNAEPSIR